MSSSSPTSRRLLAPAALPPMAALCASHHPGSRPSPASPPLPFCEPPSMLSGESMRRLAPFFSQNGSTPIDGHPPPSTTLPSLPLPSTPYKRRVRVPAPPAPISSTPSRSCRAVVARSRRAAGACW
jgi:hypothetical protein